VCYITKTRSFRLKGSNNEKLREIREYLGLDNDNMALNQIIESWHTFIIYKPAIDLFKDLIKQINNIYGPTNTLKKGTARE
jgi:hypothetical protein